MQVPSMIIGRVTLLDIILWEELSSFPLSSSSVSLLLRGGGIKIQHRELKTGKHNLRLHVKCQLKVLIIHPDMSLFVNNILALVKGSFQKNDETYGIFHLKNDRPSFLPGSTHQIFKTLDLHQEKNFLSSLDPHQDIYF